MSIPIIRAFHLFDGSLPLGGFNYSFGVEEAYYEGIDVEGFIVTTFRNVIEKGDIPVARIAFTDPWKANDISIASKLTRELREASINMGKSLAMLGLCNDDFVNEVRRGLRGSYPVVIARCCVAMKIDQVACLAGLAYSELAQMVYSAVRLGALNFIQGQKLITRVLETVSLQEEFEPFSPLLDVLSKKHEEREPKVFMS
ncbi:MULTISPECIES: urease accessory protein UreF [Metallosphaera]|uniref:Urease accessory protein UreF n=3 Tax=Metallosphaera TaxID=41980 RepID=A4YF55_METS5|nr:MULTISPECIES: urease accessory UreF family protein [Metallosphaera]ABP95057.1 Urease accessory protein UreF [Metallosphaera sedula DSM 5348]AIM27043.1 Urease accessory protein UreF [Metallosphaera sedula]AKV73959.1 urease accessory protein UreF [Metallosphaera sedula]AKV76198.1 urease accessory protein UreF [Metallosphaera sedula]AKV78451.1 urease accessory protein UreF [Metallosphaera sedula]